MADDDGHKRTSAVFRGLAEAGEGEQIALGALVRGLSDRAFGLVALIFALPNIVPMIPGVSTISGVVIAVLGLQMTVGRREPWLPGFIAAKGLPRAETAAMIARTIPWIERLETMARPRLTFMAGGAMRGLIGLHFVVLGVVLALPLAWIGNFPPGVALVVLSVGLLEEDGALIAAGHALGLFAILIVVALVGGLLAGAAFLFG